MTSRHLVDPELLPLLEVFPQLSLSHDTVSSVRETVSALGGLTDPEPFGVVREDIRLPSSGIRCLIYKPQRVSKADLSKPLPALLYLHGGGFVVGGPEGPDLQNLQTVKDLDVVIVSVSYRLAPEHPYPAALNDGYTALTWMFENAAALGIDPKRIGVGGDSAGGGHAAALAIHARDMGEHQIIFQHLVYPMLDNETGRKISANSPKLGEFIWTATDNEFGWSSYLGDQNPNHCTIPSRVKDLKGLPPAWIAVGSLDLFLDEDIAYARRLLASDVAAELQIYPGAYHGFPLAEGSALAARFWRDYRESLARGLAV